MKTDRATIIHFLDSEFPDTVESSDCPIKVGEIFCSGDVWIKCPPGGLSSSNQQAKIAKVLLERGQVDRALMAALAALKYKHWEMAAEKFFGYSLPKSVNPKLVSFGSNQSSQSAYKLVLDAAEADALEIAKKYF